MVLLQIKPKQPSLLGRFWGMDASLSWFKLVMSWFKLALKPAKDQLKLASMLQNLPNQHMLFFSTELDHVNHKLTIVLLH